MDRSPESSPHLPRHCKTSRRLLTFLPGRAGTRRVRARYWPMKLTGPARGFKTWSRKQDAGCPSRPERAMLLMVMCQTMVARGQSRTRRPPFRPCGPRLGPDGHVKEVRRWPWGGAEYQAVATSSPGFVAECRSVSVHVRSHNAPGTSASTPLPPRPSLRLCPKRYARHPAPAPSRAADSQTLATRAVNDSRNGRSRWRYWPHKPACRVRRRERSPDGST